MKNIFRNLIFSYVDNPDKKFPSKLENIFCSFVLLYLPKDNNNFYDYETWKQILMWSFTNNEYLKKLHFEKILIRKIPRRLYFTLINYSHILSRMKIYYDYKENKISDNDVLSIISKEYKYEL